MATDLFVDLTNRRLAVSETNLAPQGATRFTKGDTGEIRLYFLEATGIINAPFTVVDKSAATVKFGIGSRTGVPSGGTYTLSFNGDTTGDLAAAATAGAIESALNALSAISSAGGVTVSGSLENHFTVRFAATGSQSSLTADVTQLTPDTVAVIDERIAGSASAKEVQEVQLRLTPAVFQSSWTDLSTTVTGTISTTVTGTTTANEIQRVAFSQEPYAGTWRLTFPATALTVNSTVTSGVFITTVNHGFALNQPVTITGFDTTITGYVRGTQYYVKTTPEPTQFTLAATAGGTLITGAATAITTSGTIATLARQTAPISPQASVSDVAAALAALDSIGAGGVNVTGIVGEYYDITFVGQKGYADQPTLTLAHNLTAKQGKSANVDFATFALRDLLANENSRDLNLEIELTESGNRTTVVQGTATVAEELIDADSFSPTVGYPSYIFATTVTDYSFSGITTFSTVTGLTFTAQANSRYIVDVGAYVDASGAPSTLFGKVTYPSGSTFVGVADRYDSENQSIRTDGASLGAVNGAEIARADVGVPVLSKQRFSLQTLTTAGAVNFQTRSATAATAGTEIVKAGSWLQATKVL